MDIERLKNNRKYEVPGMFGDERQIALFYQEQPEYRIVFWKCYLMDIFCEPDLAVKEWFGFTRDWQQCQRTMDFRDDPIAIGDLDEYLNDLYTYKERMANYKDDQARECYRLICDFLAYAKKTGMAVMVDEE